MMQQHPSGPYSPALAAAAAAAARPSVGVGGDSLLALAKQNALVATRVPKFLRSLYDMLFHEDQTILAWAPDGAYFQIFDTRRLEAGVLPKYFKHSKFASFQRQLNNFGFRKWTKTQSSVCTFSHQHLVRCHPLHLAELVSRQAASPSRRTAAPRSPPNKQPKRPRETDATAAAAAAASVSTAAVADSRISPRAAKHIKRESSAAAKASPAAVHAMAPWDLNSSSQGWALDPLLFVKPEAVSDSLLAAPTDVSTAFTFGMDELSDVGLVAGADAFERTFELRMLNECLDLAPPPSTTFVSMLTDSAPTGLASIAWDAVL